MASRGKISLEIELETKKARQQMHDLMQGQATQSAATRQGQRVDTAAQREMQAQRAAAIRNKFAKSISQADREIEKTKARISSGGLTPAELTAAEKDLDRFQKLRSRRKAAAVRAQADDRRLQAQERHLLKEAQISHREREKMDQRDARFQEREETKQRLGDLKQPTRGERLREAGSKMMGGISNAGGTALMLASAAGMHQITTETLQRDVARAREDYKREAGQRQQDWDRTIRESKRDFDNLDRDRKNAQKDFDKAQASSFKNEQRALDDNNQQRIQLNNQAHRMNMAQARQRQDYEQAIHQENENFAVGLAKINLDRQRAERDLGRQTAQINLQQARREEDAQRDINALVVKRNRFERDVTKEANRDARDRAKFEERVADQQKEQLEEAEKRKKDFGLDRAIAGLGMIQAMRQGGLQGILSAYRSWENINEAEAKNQEVIDRGGLTKDQQQSIDDQRQGFDDKEEDRNTAIADFNADMITSLQEIQIALQRSRDDSAQALVDASVNYQDAIQNMNMATDELVRGHERNIAAIHQQNDRFWEDMKQSTIEWGQSWAQQEENWKRIRADAHSERMANEEAYRRQLHALAEQEHKLIDNISQALLARQREEELANINLKRAIENAATQQKLADEQLKMAIAFSLMFAGQTLTALWGAVGAVGTAATALTGAAGGLAAIATSIAAVAAVTLAAVAGAALVIQAIGAITGIKELDITKLPEAIAGFSHIGDVLANPQARVDLANELGKMPGDIGAQLAAKWGPAPKTGAQTTLGPSHQHGGFVTEPAMMIGLRNGRYMGTIAEKGPEEIRPTAAQRARQMEDFARQSQRRQIDINVNVNGYIPKDEFDKQLQDAILDTMFELEKMAGATAA